MGRSPMTEGASGQKTNFTTRGGTSPELSFPVPHTRKASGITGIGYRYPQASTTPKANDNHTARWLPQSPAMTAPSGRELWGLYLATLVCCFCGSAYCNPSVTPPACQLPLTREPAGSARRQRARQSSAARYCPSHARYRHQVEVDAQTKSPPYLRKGPGVCTGAFSSVYGMV